jgi:deazaflavin-dependent oxidoreductase (nitroreductase family)
MTSSSDFRSALDSADELKITHVGRKTGKKFSTTVWFVSDGKEKLYLLPVNGTGSKWYKNILKNPKMELQASGKKATAEARPIKDKKRVDEIVDKFRTKYGAADVKKYYPRHDAAVELSI